MIVHARRWSVIVAALAGAAVACKKAPPPPPPAAPPAAVPLSGSSVRLGKAVGADKAVAQALTTTRDTIYASVATVGSASSATIAAVWTFQTGQVVLADTQAIAPTGPAHTEFHISKPSGWPVGKYKVSISLDGALAGAQDFEVKR